MEEKASLNLIKVISLVATLVSRRKELPQLALLILKIQQLREKAVLMTLKST